MAPPSSEMEARTVGGKGKKKSIVLHSDVEKHPVRTTMKVGKEGKVEGDENGSTSRVNRSDGGAGVPEITRR